MRNKFMRIIKKYIVMYIFWPCTTLKISPNGSQAKKNNNIIGKQIKAVNDEQKKYVTINRKIIRRSSVSNHLTSS